MLKTLNLCKFGPAHDLARFLYVKDNSSQYFRFQYQLQSYKCNVGKFKTKIARVTSYLVFLMPPEPSGLMLIGRGNS